MSSYDESYFSRRRGAYLESAVKNFAIDILKYASRSLGLNLLNGGGRRALDVGCAHGYGVEVLLELGYEAYGMDISSILTKAKARSNLILASWTHLPLREEVFDLITSFEVIEHLPGYRSVYNALRRAFQVLKVGGVLIFTTPKKNAINTLSDRLHGEMHYVVEDREFWIKTLTQFTSKFTITTFTFIPMERFPIFGRFLWLPLPGILSRHIMIVAVRLR